MREGYAVQILKMGEPILTIECAMLSGTEHSLEDIEAIRDGAQHLLSFVGPEKQDDWLDDLLGEPELNALSKEQD